MQNNIRSHTYKMENSSIARSKSKRSPTVVSNYEIRKPVFKFRIDNWVWWLRESKKGCAHVNWCGSGCKDLFLEEIELKAVGEIRT